MLKRRMFLRVALIAMVAAVVGGLGDEAQAGSIKLAIVHADTQTSVDGLATALGATGFFAPIGAGDEFDASVSTPSVAQLSSYDVVLSYTNYAPADSTALGDLLHDLADLRKGVVLATYGLADVSGTVGGFNSFAGGITNPGYSPLVIGTALTDLDGTIVPINPADPLFAGVNLPTLTYYHDTFFANATLDPGATLLATDGSGIDLAALSSSGRILALNLFPGTDPTGNNDEFYKLLGNALVEVAPTTTGVPEPATIGTALAGAFALVVVGRRKRRD